MCAPKHAYKKLKYVQTRITP